MFEYDIRGWDSSIKQKIEQANPGDYDLLQAGMNSSDQFMLARYKYGDYILKQGALQLPFRAEQQLYDSRAEFPNDVKHFFGARMLPLGIVTKGYVYVVSDTGRGTSPLGWAASGDFVGTRNFYVDSVYHLKRTWTYMSGNTDIFFLPNVKNIQGYQRLRKHFGVELDIPDGFEKQWLNFKKLIIPAQIDWGSEVVYFSENTLLKILRDKAFARFREKKLAEFGEIGAVDSERFIFDLIWRAFVQKKERSAVKRYSYIYNITKNLLLISIGEGFGFAVATDNSVAPVSQLQDIYQSIYRLKYSPTMMCATKITENLDKSIYSTLQLSLCTNTTPSKSRHSMVSDMDDVREIKKVLEQFFQFVRSDEGKCLQNSVFDNLSDVCSYTYFHTAKDRLDVLSLCEAALLGDADVEHILRTSSLPFCYSSNFFKGCIKMNVRK